MDDLNEKDELWELLGRAKRTEPSPYFARKVLRAIKEEAKPAFSWAMLLRWLVPTSALAAVAIVGWTAFHSVEQKQEVAEFNAYFDTAADFESLIANEDLVVWMDVN